MKESDFTEIHTKGFDKKWWKKKAAMKCRGIGVEKALDRCKSARVGSNGLITYGDVEAQDWWDETNKALKFLELNLKKASSKCGKSQAETKKGIDRYYLPRIQENKKVLQEAKKDLLEQSKNDAKFKKIKAFEEISKNAHKFQIKKFEKLPDLEILIGELEKSKNPKRVEVLGKLLEKTKFVTMQKDYITCKKTADQLSKKFKDIKSKYGKITELKSGLKYAEEELFTLTFPLSNIKSSLNNIAKAAKKIDRTKG